MVTLNLGAHCNEPYWQKEAKMGIWKFDQKYKNFQLSFKNKCTFFPWAAMHLDALIIYNTYKYKSDVIRRIKVA